MPKVRLSWQARTAFAMCALAVIVAVGGIRVRVVGADARQADSDVHQRVTITGRVVGPDGQAAAEAQVVVAYDDIERRSACASTISAADGRFSFSLEVWKDDRCVSVVALKEGLALDWVAAKLDQEFVVQLGDDPVACAGVVTDPEGQPITGAQVWLRGVRRGGNGDRPGGPTEEDRLKSSLYVPGNTLLALRTDEEGKFEITGLANGTTVWLGAEIEGRVQDTPFEHVPSDKQDIAIVLYPEATISGRVTRDAVPVEGVGVCAQGQLISLFPPRGGGWGEAVADEAGGYTISRLPAGIYNVMLYDIDEWTAVAVEGVEVEAGDHAQGVDLKLIEGAIVEGRFVARRGDALAAAAGAGVCAYGPARPNTTGAVQSTRTDQAGRFRLRLPPGKSRLYTGGWGEYRNFEAEPSERWVELEAGEVKSDVVFFLVEKPELVLGGQVVGPDGEPMAGVKIGSTHDTGLAASDFEGQFTAESDAEGSFELELTRLGDHDGWPVLAMEPERGLAGIKLMPADKLPEEPVQITVSEGGYVTATILDTEGKPIPDVPTGLSIFPHGRGIGYGMSGGPTDENGRITIGPLPIGPTVYVRPGGKFYNLAVEPKREKAFITPGGNRELGPIVLNLEGRSLVGWVTDEKPEPVEDAIVCASGLDEPVRTNALGNFKLTGLPAAGKVWLVAMHPTEPLFAAEVFDPDWDIEPSLILRPPGSAVGRIVNEEGKPIEGARLRTYPEFPITRDDGSVTYSRPRWQGLLLARQEQRFARPVTDADGRWRMDGLIGGPEYNFGVYLPGSTGGRQRYNFIIAEPGATIDAGEVTATARPR